EAPGAEAFRYRDERLTYRDWDLLADRLAAALRAHGVERGSVVALLLPSTPLYLVGYLAAAGLGAVTTGLNVRYRRSEIRHVLRQAGARLLLAVADIEARRHPGGVPHQQRHLAPGLSFAHVGTMTRIAVQIANLGVSLIHDTFDPAAVLAAIERERLTHLGGIPTQLVALLDHP